MATKKNLGSETNSARADADAAGKSPVDETAAKPVVRKKRTTAQKVADAVSETVKELAHKVTGKSSSSRAAKSAAVGGEAAPAAKPSSRKTASVEADAETKPTNKTIARAKTPTKRTKIGALSADVSSEDVRESLNDLANSESIPSEDDIESSAATDIKEHFFQDQNNHPGPPPPQPSRDVPHEYGDTKLVLMIRDPEWVYAYWEISDDTRNALELPRNGDLKRYVLRLYKVTGRRWPDEAAHYFFDVEVTGDSKSWYVQLPEPDEMWCAELGVIDNSDNYTLVCRSNPVNTPRNSISEYVDSEWMTVEESFEKITRLSGAGEGAHLEQFLRGDTSTSSESILRHVHRQLTGLFPGERVGLSSGIFSSESAIRHKDFWLQVHTELILYGATEPDAKVTVQGRPVTLSDDGTFSIRYALPDGEQVLDVHARNADGDREESITPVVERNTR